MTPNARISCLALLLAACASPPPSSPVTSEAPPAATTSAPRPPATREIIASVEIDLRNEPLLTLSFPTKLIPIDPLLPRLGTARAELERAVAARKAAMRARHAYDSVLASESGRVVREAHDKSDAADDADKRAFATARSAMEQALRRPGGDRVALLLASEYLRTSAEEESNASVGTVNEIVGFGLDPGAYARPEDAKCDAALAAAKADEPLLGYLVDCVDRRRFPSLARTAAAQLAGAAKEDAALAARCPPDHLAALHARRALRAVHVRDYDAAETALSEALAAPEAAAPSRAELTSAAAEVAARRGDDRAALVRAAAGLADGGALGPSSGRMLDLALEAWIRSGGALDGPEPGMPTVAAFAAILELARDRRDEALARAREASRDPAACMLASEAMRQPMCTPTKPSVGSAAIVAGSVRGRAMREAYRVGGGPSDVRVLRSVARACVLRDPSSGDETYPSRAPTRGKEDACIRDAMARLVPGASYRVRVKITARQD